jgi:hypothetical protein
MGQHSRPVAERRCRPLLDSEIPSLRARARRPALVAALALPFALACAQMLTPQVAAAPTPSVPEIAKAGAATSAAAPSSLAFTRLTVADGLSRSDVRSIVQDRQGFMWFATWLGGLDRWRDAGGIRPRISLRGDPAARAAAQDGRRCRRPLARLTCDRAPGGERPVDAPTHPTRRQAGRARLASGAEGAGTQPDYGRPQAKALTRPRGPRTVVPRLWNLAVIVRSDDFELPLRGLPRRRPGAGQTLVLASRVLRVALVPEGDPRLPTRTGFALPT